MSDSSAMEELARDPASRKRFLKIMGGTGAASAFSIFLAACGSDKKSTTTSAAAGTTTASSTSSAAMRGDLKILNYALTLEYLEADFYKKAGASGKLKGKVLDVAKKFGETEQEHVDALTATIKKLGGTPVAKPQTKFPLASQGSILALAATVENLGAAAYLGQAGNIKNKEVLAAALSIHSVEARHASALNLVLGKKITPDGAFAKPASMAQVLPKVKPFIVA